MKYNKLKGENYMLIFFKNSRTFSLSCLIALLNRINRGSYE